MNVQSAQDGDERRSTGRPEGRSVEIVIPSYGRLAILRRTFRQLRQTYPDVPVCLGIQDRLQPEEIADLSGRDGNVRIELLAEPGTTAALNHCILSSRADIVLIMDDDAVPCHGWVEAHLSAFASDPALAYTSGREVRSSRGRSSFSELVRIMAESAAGLFLGRERKINGRIVGWTTGWGMIFGNFDQPGSCRINAPRGCNMAVRRREFAAAGGFDTAFRGNAWGFEAEFGLRLARQGRFGRYVGNAIVIHHELPTGGSRTAGKDLWFRDFMHNHHLLMRRLGPLGWIGSLPRLIKKRFFS